MRLRPRIRRTLAGIATLLLTGSSPGIAQEEEDLDDLMGGFDDDFDAAEVLSDEEEIPAWLEALPFGDVVWERVDLSGSIAGGAVYNTEDHAVTNPDNPARRTHWGGLSRLDLDGFLQLDVDLPADWLLRAEALGWYDFAYRIRGRGKYSGAVIDVYEWQVDSGEVYVSGPVNDWLDVTLGRKIVNWGRSDTFRVVDVVNPLDNKEPGLVDIEDLRRPVTMLKLDAARGPWSGTAVMIGERRYDRLPPPGSDFYPDIGDFPPGSSLPLPIVVSPIEDSDDFEGTPDFAARFGGSFSRWDFTLYGAWKDENTRVVDLIGNQPRSESNRFGLVGVGGNYTSGAWLFKLETAFLTRLHVLRAISVAPFAESDDADRIDTMVGVEYYGPDSLIIALEVVNRHWTQSSSDFIATGRTTEQSSWETGLRISRPFFRERLDLTLLAVAFGERLQDGTLLRLTGDWELTDSWLLTGGGLFFFRGDDRNDGIGVFESNDRVFVELKYSF